MEGRDIPLNRYYSGKGEKVMRDMVSRYGTRKGKQVFYATANKRKLKRPKTSRHGRRGE